MDSKIYPVERRVFKKMMEKLEVKHSKNRNFYRNNNRFINLFILLIFVTCSLTPAQSEKYNFDKITIDDGLSQSTVFSIIQDKKGYLWFGTQDGLNRYDGRNIKVYLTDADDSTAISDTWISKIVEDRDGYLWIGTQSGGLNRYDPVKEEFTHFTKNDNEYGSIDDNTISDIFIDFKDRIWVCTRTGVNLYNKKTENFTRIPFAEAYKSNQASVNLVYADQYNNLLVGTSYGIGRIDTVEKHIDYDLNSHPAFFDLLNFTITSLKEDYKGNLWIGTKSAGIFKYNLIDQSLIQYRHNVSNRFSLSSNSVIKIFSDSDNKVWIATDDGLNIYSSERDGFIVLRSDPSDNSSLNSSQILDICQDRSGIIWIGCFAGAINKFDKKSRVFEHYQHNPSERNTLVHNDVWTFTEDSKGIVWIGTNKGFCRYNPQTNRFSNFRHNPEDKNSLTYDIVRIIFADHRDKIWLGTDGGGLDLFDPVRGTFTHYQTEKNNPNAISSNKIRAITEDKQGYIWIGTWDGLDRLNPANGRITHFRNDEDEDEKARDDRLRLLDKTQDKVVYVDDAGAVNTISDNRIRSLYESRDGKLWICTYGGFNVYDPETEKFKSFRQDQNRSKSLSNDRVLGVHEDRRGVLWIGTFNGLNRFDRETSTFKVYQKRDGLPNDVIYGILEDDEGFIWISTNRGLSRFDPRLESPEFRNFNVLDGLQSNEFNGGAYLKTNDGELYFGGINGFNKFNPGNVKQNDFIPNVVITDFKIFDKSIKNLGELNSLSQLSLTYKDRYVSFEFAALDFTNPKKNQYAYKLDGLDDEWIECGNRSSATYTNLDGGEYTFLVRGSNNDGVWNPEPAKLSVYVTPPIWGYLWVQITLAMMAVLLGVVIYRGKMNRVKEHRYKLETQVNQRTMELKSTNENLTQAQSESQRLFSHAVLLNEIGQRISSELDLDSLLNEIVTSAQENFGYYNVMLLMVVEDGSGLQLQSIAGGYKDVYSAELYIPMGEGMVGQAAFAQGTQLSNDVSTEDNFKRKLDIHTKSELSVPIVIGSEVYGVLDIQSDQLNAFNKADINAFETFSSQIASAINNARLFTKNRQELNERRKAEEALRKSRDTLLKAQRETHRRATQASLLYELGQKISNELDLDKLLSDIVHNACDAFDYYNVMLLLYDKKKGGVALKSIAGGYESIFPKDLYLKLGEGVIGNAAKTRETQICNNVEECDYYVIKANEVTRSELSVPFFQGDELIGVLDIQSEKPDAFDDVDVSTLETFSTQIAGAITNARLYVKAQEELKERERAEQQVRESLERLEISKKETDNIFKNVEEGIFLLNRDGAISGQYSKSLERVLSSTNLGNQNFVCLLEHKIPDTSLKSTKEYLNLMFKEDIDEDMVFDLNPISEIELSFANEKDSSKDIKYLSFRFKRIYDAKEKITELIATVRNITDEKSLAQKLEESEVQQKKQMEWMLSVLHVEAPLLQEFIKGVKDELNTIDKTLQSNGENVDYCRLLEEVYRSMHIIKGNASLLDLKFFSQKAHEFEEQIELIREMGNISGSSFVPLILRLSDIRNTLSELKGLAERISKIHTNFRPKRSYESDIFKQSLTNMISNVARDVGKKVEFEVNDFDPNAIPFHYRLTIKEILIQLIRNSVYHGIESAEERKKINKAAAGKIILSSFVLDNKFGVKFRDDGRGLQLEKIKDKALKSGRWKAEEINKWDRSRIAQLIFEHGISTADSKTLTAGRGVGMDIIEEKIKKMEGTVDIRFKEGKYTEFEIVLPSNRKRY